MNVSGSWSWQASNKDHDPQSVFWDLNSGSDYKLLVSGRSRGHDIDRILLWDRSRFRYGNLVTGRTTTLQNTRSDELPPSELVELGGGDTQFSVQATAIGDLNEGAAPFSIDDIRDALQIDAAVVANRHVWTRATVNPGIEAGLYDVKNTAMQETDGESPYQLLINSIIVATKVNDKINSACFGSGVALDSQPRPWLRSSPDSGRLHECQLHTEEQAVGRQILAWIPVLGEVGGAALRGGWDCRAAVAAWIQWSDAANHVFRILPLVAGDRAGNLTAAVTSF